MPETVLVGDVWKGGGRKKERICDDILGIDSDNGGKSINIHLHRYCQAGEITFTRTRGYRNNDNCLAEQKNYFVVKRAVGYGRYRKPAEQGS